ncbi:MAG: 50S ribosomal protein L6 [Candidatus Omnitrophota bacterium]|jgi:large subunit ribosomal protein L6
MSRVGRRPIDIPSGIKVDISGNTVKIEGKGKKLEYVIPDGYKVEAKDNKLEITRPSDSSEHRALHGTTRSLIQNIIIGLTTGFEKKLQIQGVGYKAQVKGKNLVLDIGFSHSVNYTPPEGVTIETTSPTEIVVKGIDKQQVGEAASEIRDYYPPEPYKGKGIRYVGEYVRQKQGKSIA